MVPVTNGSSIYPCAVLDKCTIHRGPRGSDSAPAITCGIPRKCAVFEVADKGSASVSVREVIQKVTVTNRGSNNSTTSVMGGIFCEITFYYHELRRIRVPDPCIDCAAVCGGIMRKLARSGFPEETSFRSAPYAGSLIPNHPAPVNVGP